MAELFYGIIIFLLVLLFANMFYPDFVDDQEIMREYEKAKEKVDKDINNE